jgi:excisionase family DNA binding protein
MTRHHGDQRIKPANLDPTMSSQPGQPDDPERENVRIASSVAEAAFITGLSRDLLYDQMRCGNLSYIKIGRRRIITRQHLNQFLGVAS